jgi:radical SAM protein with 4Fe4S-binding SPASM domain
VPEGHNDRKLCEQIRKTAQLFKPSAKTITGYTILTTTGCNARCFYCYEKGTKPVTMTAETASKVVRYILAHRGEEKVNLSWFGGEPLYNVRVIDQICSELKEHGVIFKSKMTSNGYLFDAEMVQRAKDLWQLKNVQITLDGREKTYNLVKRYIYENVNAFERVLKNIELLTAADIHVQIRLNVDQHNIEEMLQLVPFLNERFGANKNLTIYSHELFGERTPEESAALYEQRMKLEALIAECGNKRKHRLQSDIKLNHCMADNDNIAMISPSGYLGKCEHYIDREFFGHIDRKDRDKDVLQKFKERPADIAECASCPYYPQCFRLVMCDNGADCTPERQKENIHNVIEAMKDEYEKWKKGNVRCLMDDV